MMKWRIQGLAFLMMAQHAAAQDADALEAQTREVGVAVGQAYTCLADTDERRERMKLASKAIYNMIVHDLGSDMAYAFATSAGFGAGKPRDDARCKELAERWEAIKENFDVSAILEDE
ncbi:MAG: hypothetical protein AAF526_03065 [Pseudomonadota bacterium]